MVRKKMGWMILAAVCVVVFFCILGLYRNAYSTPTENITAYVGEIKDVDTGSDIKDVSVTDRKVVAVDKKGSTLTVIPKKKGASEVTLSFLKKKSSLFPISESKKIYKITIKESPVKGEAVSLTEDIYGNRIAIMKAENTSGRTLADVSIDYSIRGKENSVVLADGTQTFTALRPKEVRYFTALLEKQSENQSSLDAEASTVKAASIRTAKNDKTDDISDKVKVTSDIEKAMEDGSRYAKVTVKNSSGKDASVLVTFVYYDADGKVSNIWTDETIYPAGRKTANTYDVTFDKDRDKSVKAIYQVFEA